MQLTSVLPFAHKLHDLSIVWYILEYIISSTIRSVLYTIKFGYSIKLQTSKEQTDELLQKAHKRLPTESKTRGADCTSGTPLSDNFECGGSLQFFNLAKSHHQLEDSRSDERRDEQEI